MQQHSLHEDCTPVFSTSSDREPPSSGSWAAQTTCSSVDHMQAAVAPPGSFFRQLFAEETDAGTGGYVEDLLQLQLPPSAETVPPFDMLSSDIFHPRHDSYASSQLHRCVGDLRVPTPFSVESYINNSGSACAALNTDHSPHTLEFVVPPASASSSVLTFQGSNSSLTASTISRTSASTLLPDAQISPCHSPHNTDHDGVHYSKPSSVNADDGDEQHTAASSCKKAKLQASEQCNSAGTDPSQLMIGKKGRKYNELQARSKEKLGERINALQQLVSPFGKTDTASVLSEAIGYIKFLQEQVQVLSSPYMKPSSSLMTASSRQNVGAESASDLRSRGLCLVPVSCTINVANNNNFNIGADYWASTPSLGGTAGGSATTARFSASS